MGDYAVHRLKIIGTIAFSEDKKTIEKIIQKFFEDNSFFEDMDVKIELKRI